MNTWVNSSENKTFVDVLNNITLQDDDGDLNDAMFRKIGSDFGLAVEALLPPPTLWASRGFDWEFDSFASSAWRTYSDQKLKQFRPKPNNGVEKRLKEHYFFNLTSSQELDSVSLSTTTSVKSQSRKLRPKLVRVRK